jgi:hypothetical protein
LFVCCLCCFRFFSSFLFMDGYDAASRALRWDFGRSGSSAEFLQALRQHASTLRQLHVL